MTPRGKDHRFDSRLLMVGFGSIGQGVLPLLLRHIEMSPRQITIVSADEAGAEVARAYGVELLCRPLTPQNLAQVLEPLLGEGDFLLNVSVDVSSVALVAWCTEHGVPYLDTGIEPWAGGHVDRTRPPAERSNYALREAALALRRPRGGGPTAVLTHGANPGLVSHFVKQALIDVAQATGVAAAPPATREGWARLSRDLGVRVIHVAERDTQVASRRKAAGEFVNTWSVEGFIGEGCQPAELGWGTHERQLPPDARRHDYGSRAAIYLLRPGAGTRVRSWTPLAGPQHGWLITHSESISIADHLTLGSPTRPDYRPTVHYAYHPCDDAVLSLDELAARNWRPQPRLRVLKEDITTGMDELGVLLMGHARGAYWYGSQLSIERARALAPHNSATSLQVTAAVMAGVVWAMCNPQRGVVEPDDLPYAEILALCRPYLGEVVGVFSSWTPLDGRGWLFDEDLDRDDPWQFRNFRVE
ncbi:MAG: saccharopine dehydrogenase NADP-binding domain-containing protein [Rubrivivax sp.]|nr:saccharopine dehydrogenase NADP-binding domain-containing protein [Rubrivivax sp.]